MSPVNRRIWNLSGDHAATTAPTKKRGVEGIRFFDMFGVRGAAAKTVIPQEMGYRETVSSARYMKRAGMFMLKSLWVKSFFLAFC